MTTKTITDATFEAEVLKSDKPVLVDFWAPWCPPCRAMAPILDMIAREQSEKLIVAKLNVDENPAMAAEYQIMSIPTLLLFEKGEVKKALIGMVPKMVLEGELSEALGG